MKTLRLILGDQLSLEMSSLKDADRATDVVFLAELNEETTYVPHHKQKIVLFLSAMRHFAEELREENYQVDYVPLDDPANTGSFAEEVARAADRHRIDRVIVTEPGEYRVWEAMQDWESELGVPVEILPDDRFFCSRAEFADWSHGRKTLRMEHFYREMRRKTGWLIDEEGKPEGGKWNFDADNRKRLPKDVDLPPRLQFDPDDITRQVSDLVAERFASHIGTLETFRWAVNREDARAALAHFIDDCLPRFGTYQDAMKAGEDLLFHALLSPYINIGLLNPCEVCEAALEAYDRGEAPINAVEGFVRQILGWREYIRGIYWLKMPDYAESNFLEAHRSLPEFYWTGDTEMNCLRETIEATRRNAYAHHIQRLMITGNFALLAGIEPEEVEAWYLAVYADAVEWVELPNTHGMALFADGGILGSKPYAASGAYVNRMSDYCKGCDYSPSVKLGDGACPLNYLYWNFMMENEDQLRDNPRMAFPYRNLARMSGSQRAEIREQAETYLDGLA